MYAVSIHIYTYIAFLIIIVYYLKEYIFKMEHDSKLPDELVFVGSQSKKDCETKDTQTILNDYFINFY